MEALFKKYFWVVKALGIAAASGLAASAIVTQVGTRMMLDVSESGASPDPAVDEGDEEDEDEDRGLSFGDRPFGSSAGSGRATAKNRTAEEIQKRNIFCPTCAPEEQVAVLPGNDGPVDDIPAGTVKSSLPLKLVATMIHEDPERSVATIYDADSEVTGLYAVGDLIRPAVQTVSVKGDMVLIRNNAQIEYISLGEAQQPQARRPEKDESESRPRPRRRNKREIPGAEDAINCPNDNLCTVERSFVEKLMANPALLAKQARIVPSQRDGETRGFKFYGIRRGSLPKLLGLKNGDMLTEVNGEALDSVDKAMALYTKLRRASNLNVTVVRKGETISKEIQIQ